MVFVVHPDINHLSNHPGIIWSTVYIAHLYWLRQGACGEASSLNEPSINKTARGTRIDKHLCVHLQRCRGGLETDVKQDGFFIWFKHIDFEGGMEFSFPSRLGSQFRYNQCRVNFIVFRDSVWVAAIIYSEYSKMIATRQQGHILHSLPGPKSSAGSSPFTSTDSVSACPDLSSTLR